MRLCKPTPSRSHLGMASIESEVDELRQGSVALVPDGNVWFDGTCRSSGGGMLSIGEVTCKEGENAFEKGNQR